MINFLNINAVNKVKHFSIPCHAPLLPFYNPWKHQKTTCFLLTSGGIERNYWLEMGLWFAYKYTYYKYGYNMIITNIKRKKWNLFKKKLLKHSGKSHSSIMSSKVLWLSKICGKTWEQNPQQNSLIFFWSHILLQ